MRLNELAKIMKTAGDESRLAILRLSFKNKGACVSDVAKKLDMSVAIVSHHLHILAGAGLLVPKRNGKRVCYGLSNSTAVKKLQKFIFNK